MKSPGGLASGTTCAACRSLARSSWGTARPDSDIDLLVEFEPGQVPGLLALANMEIELSELLGGRRVDLRTAEDLSRDFREEVVRTAEVQYAR